MRTLKKSIRSLLSIGILCLVWEVLAITANNPALVPGLPELFVALGKLWVTPEFYLSVLATLGRGVAGLLVSGVLALLFALLFARHEQVYGLFKPLLTLMRSVPVISFILLALLFLQPEQIPFMIAFLTMFPLLSENLTKGLLHLRAPLSVMGMVFHMNRTNRFTQIVYPQIKPFLFSGLASAAGFGWRAIIMGEVLSQCAFGIGSEMKRAQTFIEVPELLAWTVIAVALSFAFDRGLDRLSKLDIPVRYRKTDCAPATCGGPEVILEQVSVGYGHRMVLDNLTQRFEGGRVYGLSAPSGRGKTTLLRLIDGSLKPASGKIGKGNIQAIAAVFQEPALLNHLSATDNIALPLASFYTKEKSMQLARHFCSLMELDEVAEHRPEALSYGQQQRVAIARALAFPSPLLLMDEPFKGLDDALTARIINQIKTLHKINKQTIIFVSHQPDSLSLLADETIKL